MATCSPSRRCASCFSPTPSNSEENADLRYALRRLLLLFPTLWGVATAVFLVLRVIPGDPVLQLAGDLAQRQDLTIIRHQLGLDRPLQAQYGDYLLRLARGDLGVSFQTRSPVMTVSCSSTRRREPNGVKR